MGIGVYLYPHNSPMPQPPGFQGSRCRVQTVGGVLSPTEPCLHIGSVCSDPCSSWLCYAANLAMALCAYATALLQATVCLTGMS